MTDSSNVKVGKELIKFLTDLPPFDLGSMLVTKGRNNIGNNFYDSPDEFVKDFKNKYKLNSQKLLKKIDKNELNYYILYSTKLGWINCDRFYKIPKDQKRDLIVKVPDDKTKVYLLYKTIRGIQSEMAFNKKAVFKELPLNSEIKIVVIHDKDNKTEIRKSDIIIGRQSEIDFKKMQTVPLINLDKELEL